MEPDVSAVSSPASTEPAIPPSPAEAAVSSHDFTAFQQAKRDERMGQVPGLVSPKPVADPASAPPAGEQDTEKAAAPPVTSADPSKSPQKRGAETRKAQLDQEIQDRLRRRHDIALEIAREEGRLAALRHGAQPQDAKPAASSTAQPESGAAHDPEPQLADFEADSQKYPDPWTAHQRALAKWEGRQAARDEFTRLTAERDQRTAQEQSTREQADRYEKAAGAWKAAEKADPGIRERLTPIALQLKPFSMLEPNEQPTALNALAEEVLRSTDPVGMLEYFSDHPDEFEACKRMNPPELLMKVGEVRALIRKPASQAPPINTETKAPPPPVVLGSRPATSGDPKDNAVKSGDFEAFQRAKRQERMAGVLR